MSAREFEPVFIGPGGTPGPILAADVGSKAAELARLAALRLPVPPAFVLPTSLCAGVVAGDAAAIKALRKGLVTGVGWLEQTMKRRLGDARAPLFVSVRSGAERSMPGMLDTILDVGMNGVSVHGLIRLTGNPRMAFDSWRRFIQGHAEVVGLAAPGGFAALVDDMVRAEGVANDAELDSEALERLVDQFLAHAARLGVAPPEEPIEQIAEAAEAVYRSWEGARAREYRRLNGLEFLKGTAVTVQAMAFGNSGGDSGAGVAFSRDPATGAKRLYVDFLADAQGEDVVSGRRSPADSALFARRMPEVARALEAGARTLEAACRDVQDIEFTVERGKLWFLQTRSAKRTPLAALKIAVDLVEEGVIERSEAVARVSGIDLAAARVSRFADAAAAPAARATVASPGVACGRAAFTSDRAKAFSARGEAVILVRRDTSTEDVAGFAAADGVLTAVGGRTAHAAVVARQMGKVCLVGCRSLAIDEGLGSARLGAEILREGDFIALDGATGDVSLGLRTVISEDAPEAAILRRWREAAS
ncbi:pyruvate,orthophosphate dikinase [Roseiarcus fermentans]|uniref:Pyruvate,orthophosphate dikinase n=1 Tax=Roseiarcus fermentans TaxID=1473586 RepID=A0A366FCX2_9HYPH|nr:PEP/pyruvate-binding domain-containing protein [Roseiarcus fermentans]RBP11936.1 pyruvate,orthophosphate dikinase [Roseiarcus fermentans]